MIIPSAYLAYPEPGNPYIARLVFSDATKSSLLVTKRQALETAEAFFGISLDEFELRAIKEQIHGSQLIDKSKELEEFSSHTAIQFDELSRRINALLEQFKRCDDDENKWRR